MIEQVALAVISAAIGYLIYLMQKFDERLDSFLARLIRIELILPKRFSDRKNVDSDDQD